MVQRLRIVPSVPCVQQCCLIGWCARLHNPFVHRRERKTSQSVRTVRCRVCDMCSRRMCVGRQPSDDHIWREHPPRIADHEIAARAIAFDRASSIECGKLAAALENAAGSWQSIANGPVANGTSTIVISHRTNARQCVRSCTH